MRRTRRECAWRWLGQRGGGMLPGFGRDVALAQQTSWRNPAAEAAAKAEGGSLVVYSSINEQEALPVWRYFEDTTGIKVAYVRGSDTTLISRVMIEHRAQQRSWDLMLSTGTGRLPPETLVPFEPAGSGGVSGVRQGSGQALVRHSCDLQCACLQYQDRAAGGV